jgi:L-asparaginase / beta-aspartyl-peptidase
MRDPADDIRGPMTIPPLRPALVVHGGAGLFPAERHEAARAGCRRAAEAGLAVLAQGGSALDAVCAAVRVLEDEPTFNAGVGAVLTRDGTVEMDAAVMDGETLRSGAIGAMANARQPIDIARAVLEAGEHVLLCGEGAWRFAREHGFFPCDPAELITERARERLAAEIARHARGEGGRIDPGTVGACAVDARGHVAAATSTGGMTFKRVGRIGDTPLPGCGTYADDRAGAASATGEGERIIDVTMARVCVDARRACADASAAAWAAVDELGDRVGGQGGIVCCDRRGNLGAAHNSPTMAWASGGLGEGGAVEITAADVRVAR